MKRHGKGYDHKIVHAHAVKRKHGFTYFVDGDGNVREFRLKKTKSGKYKGAK
jgi:hypothetical protein